MAFNFGRDKATGRPIMRDIVGKGERYEEEAPRPKARQEGSSVPVKVVKKSLFEEKVPALHPASSQKSLGERLHGLYWLVGITAVLGGAWLLLNFFSYVDVSITPKQEFVEVDLPIRASAGVSRDIGLEIITLEERREEKITITAKRALSEKASGNVMIYNAYSVEPQTLVAGTRLEAPGGKIYRIEKTITVPGAKMADGKLSVQGVEVKVTADKPGEVYNIGLVDFTIPGFKGTPRYQKFYARSKTDMTGGIVGNITAVTEQDVLEAIENSKAHFSQVFNEKIRANLPAGVLLPENSFRVTYSAAKVDPPLNSKASEATIEVLAVFEGFGLNRKDLEETVVTSYVTLQPDETVAIENIEELTFEKVSEDFQNKVANFRVQGKAHFVWVFDETELKNELIASPDRTKVFEQYPAIERAEINFKPAWWRMFPKDLERVKVERILESG